MENEDKKQTRQIFAVIAMHALIPVESNLARSEFTLYADTVAKESVAFADALIAALEEKRESQ